MEERIKEIKELEVAGPVCQQISAYCKTGWPDKMSLTAPLKPYFSAFVSCQKQMGFSCEEAIL